jgi:hypothetical protein
MLKRHTRTTYFKEVIHGKRIAAGQTASKLGVRHGRCENALTECQEKPSKSSNTDSGSQQRHTRTSYSEEIVHGERVAAEKRAEEIRRRHFMGSEMRVPEPRLTAGAEITGV